MSVIASSIDTVIINTLREEVKPAMGCTEPVAVALAVAKAKELCFGSCTTEDDLEDMEVHVTVSPNIFKNGLSVGIPGTDQVGLIIATALGITSCHSDLGLEVFKDVRKKDIDTAYALIKQKKINLSIADTDKKVYIQAIVRAGSSIGKAIIQDRHDHFVHLESRNGILFHEDALDSCECVENPLFALSIEEIVQIVERLPFDKISFLLEGFSMNEAMANYGLSRPCGMSVGLTLQNTKHLNDDLMNRAMVLTAAASDARMSGVSLPVMSSNGSGNNGLTALLPIVAYAKANETSDDALARAAAISHLVNSVIKKNIGRLSALCGCGVAAGTGASVAITWLMGGTQAQVSGAVQNMIANTTGMICDGAKVGCSLKLATSASAAVQSAILAINGIVVPGGNGIIGSTADVTIHNLGTLSKNAMDNVDKVILNIMNEYIA